MNFTNDWIGREFHSDKKGSEQTEIVEIKFSLMANLVRTQWMALDTTWIQTKSVIEIGDRIKLIRIGTKQISSFWNEISNYLFNFVRADQKSISLFFICYASLCCMGFFLFEKIFFSHSNSRFYSLLKLTNVFFSFSFLNNWFNVHSSPQPVN